MIINHNTPATLTNNALTRANKKTDKASRNLSTGLRINSAADDAAGLAISTKMKNQIRGMEMANRNNNDGISLIQTAEGGLSEVQNMLTRMRELAVQGANDTLTTSDRLKIQDEVNQLIDEIDSTSSKIQFNTKQLLNGTHASLVFQVGQNEGLNLSVTMESITAEIDPDTGGGLGLKGETVMSGLVDSEGNDVSTNFITVTENDDGTTTVEYGTGENAYLSYYTVEDCGNAILACDAAIDDVSKMRSKLGAVQNRLEYTISNLDTSIENAEKSLSTIEDTDMAAEMTEYTKNNVIVQAGISMLSQANQRPNQLLSLLQ